MKCLTSSLQPSASSWRRSATPGTRRKKTALKTTLKKFDAAVAEGNRDAAAATYKVAVKTVDRACPRACCIRTNAAHKKSKMAVKLNGIG